MNFFIELWQHTLTQRCLIFILALLLSRLFPIPRTWQPLVWFSIIANELALKVNHPKRAVSQQLIAGILATLILVVPIVTIAAIALEIVAYPQFFEFIILYIALSYYHFSPSAKLIYSALSNDNNQAAKHELSHWTTQYTYGLSSIGLCKATIEKTITSPVYGVISCLLFYYLGGGSAVMSIVLLRQLEVSWPSYHPRYQVFSSFVTQFNRVMFFIPKLAWHIALALPFGRSGFYGFNKQDEISLGLYNDFNTLYLAAHLLQVELGGPQQFTAQPSLKLQTQLSFKQTTPALEKVVMTRVKAGRPPTHQNLMQVIKSVKSSQFFLLTLFLLLPLLWTVLRVV